MDLGHALQTYTVLTIGDGLVTVIPALMISISGGLIVTRASSDTRLGAQFQDQVFGKPEPLMLASGVLLALAIIPGLPTCPFWFWAAAWQRRLADAPKTRRRRRDFDGFRGKTSQGKYRRSAAGGSLNGRSGTGISEACWRRIELAAAAKNCRHPRNLAVQLGYFMPPVKVNDNSALRSREYSILLKGVEVARYELPAGQELAIPSTATTAVGRQADQRSSVQSAAGGYRERRSARARRLYGCGFRECAGHAFFRSRAAPRPGTLHSAGHQEVSAIASLRPIRRWSRIWCRKCYRCRDSASVAEPVEGTGLRFAMASPFWRRLAKPAND